MKERPILFSASMVRAILDGSKTQTRRVVKPRKDGLWGVPLAACEIAGEINQGHYSNSVFGEPGDRLWARETFNRTNPGGDTGIYFYRADNNPAYEDAIWKPSIFMPRAASRITLEITAVRVERLQDISEDDAIAEGISRVPFRPDDGWPICDGYMIGPDDAKTSLQTTAAKAYRGLWDSINGPGSWALNPFVWVVEFKRVAQ